MLAGELSTMELLASAAATARSKQEKLHELRLTTTDEVSSTKVGEAHILVQLASPGTTEDMPEWAVDLVLSRIFIWRLTPPPSAHKSNYYS